MIVIWSRAEQVLLLLKLTYIQSKLKQTNQYYYFAVEATGIIQHCLNLKFDKKNIF